MNRDGDLSYVRTSYILHCCTKYDYILRFFLPYICTLFVACHSVGMQLLPATGRFLLVAGTCVPCRPRRSAGDACAHGGTGAWMETRVDRVDRRLEQARFSVRRRRSSHSLSRLDDANRKCTLARTATTCVYRTVARSRWYLNGGACSYGRRAATRAAVGLAQAKVRTRTLLCTCPPLDTSTK